MLIKECSWESMAVGDRQESWMEGYFKKSKGLGDESHRWVWLQQRSKPGKGHMFDAIYGWHRAIVRDEVDVHSLLSCLHLQLLLLSSIKAGHPLTTDAIYQSHTGSLVYQGGWCIYTDLSLQLWRVPSTGGGWTLDVTAASCLSVLIEDW